MVILFVFLGIILLVPLGFGVFNLVLMIKSFQECTEAAEAGVIGYIKSDRTDGEGYSVTQHIPVFTYNTPKGEITTNDIRIKKGLFTPYEAGKIYMIRYNPDKPEQFIIPAQRVFNIITMVLSILFISGIMSIIMYYLFTLR